MEVPKAALTPYTKVRDIILHQDTSIAHTLCGSCYSVRKGKKYCFIELLDGSTVRTLQCMFPSTMDALAKHCNRGATVELTGKVIPCPDRPHLVEFHVESYVCLGGIKDPSTYILDVKGFTTRDTLRAIPHKRHHTQLFAAIQIIKQRAYDAYHTAMRELGIGEIQPTLITGNECEAGACPFTVTTIEHQDYAKDFFSKRAFLTVSSQLHLEATVLGTKRDGYCMTTAFRAEPSKSPMHLAEFLMPEWELIGGGLERNMAVAQYTLKRIIQAVLDDCLDELKFLEQYKQDEERHVTTPLEAKPGYDKTKPLPPLIERLRRYVAEDFVISSHEECVRIMLQDVQAGKAKFEVKPTYDGDLSREHEYYITEVIYGGLPVFVRYFPKDIKAFYMPVIKEDSPSGVEHIDGYDLLFPYCGEVVGGSQRIHQEEELVDRMAKLGMCSKDLDWYIDLRRDASLPHGGAGLGFGRMLIVITGIHNIKDMQEFPRAYGLACHA